MGSAEGDVGSGLPRSGKSGIHNRNSCGRYLCQSCLTCGYGLLSDMTDAELAALEQRMIAAAPIIARCATAEASDDAGELPDGDTDAERDFDGCVDDEPPDASA